MEYYFQRQYFFLFLFLLCSGFLSSSSAYYKFYADEKHGWELNASKNNQWAGEYRFLINDDIFFKYKNRSDSVLVVNEVGYSNCNKANPEEKLDAGDSGETGNFTFYRHGPFYFISRYNCEKEQKLIVVVLSPRNPGPNLHPPGYSSPPEPTTPSPSSPPKTPWAINPAILLVGSASLLVLVLLISKKKKKKVNN